MAWTKKKPIEPWVINPKPDPCDCSQDAKLRVSGYSEKQGPTHFCPVCRWAFWPWEMKPSADQINLMKKTYPEACEANMKYTKLRTSAQPKWGSTSDVATIDQVGKLQPDFMMAKDLEHFNKKYCEKYPSSEMAKRRAEAKEAKEKYEK